VDFDAETIDLSGSPYGGLRCCRRCGRRGSGTRTNPAAAAVIGLTAFGGAVGLFAGWIAPSSPGDERRRPQLGLYLPRAATQP
jgi:hypothetical protein